MEIKNFTDTSIRIGEFPSCLDIMAIPGYHSGDGFIAHFFHTRLDKEKHFMQIRKRKDTMKKLTLKIGKQFVIFKKPKSLKKRVLKKNLTIFDFLSIN